MSNDQNGANAETLAPNEGKGADQKVMISSYTILIVITLIVGVATIVLSRIMPGVTAASLSDILTSPISGFLDGIEVSLFLLILGGCLGIVNKLGALDAGIAALVRALHGRETILIAAIMVVFAIMGSTYGFCEETSRFTRCCRPPCSRRASTPWSPQRRCCSAPVSVALARR